MLRQFGLYSLILSGMLLSAPTTGVAQTAGAADEDSLPEALSNLMVVTYACQALNGPEPYVKAKDMAHSVIEKLADTATADRWVATEEDNAKTACADTKTCWQSLLDDGVAPTPANGKSACDDFTQLAGTKAADLVDKAAGGSNS